MANGWLVSPSATSVNPCPVASTSSNVITCTFSSAVRSSPRGAVVPVATSSPSASSSCHGSGSVSSVTSDARFGPVGR